MVIDWIIVLEMQGACELNSMPTENGGCSRSGVSRKRIKCASIRVERVLSLSAAVSHFCVVFPFVIVRPLNKPV